MAAGTILAKRRDIKGKQTARLRKEGLVPAVLYGKDLKPVAVTVNLSEFEKVFKKAGTSTILNLQLDNADHDVLIKEVALDPVKDLPRHVDFYQIKKGEKIRVKVPLHFENEAPAVKEFGGLLVTSKDEVEIECWSKDLPRAIIVDLSSLKELEASLHIKDIQAPANVKILDPADEVVAVITKPKEEKEEVVVSEAEALAAVEAEAEKAETAEKTNEENAEEKK
jgi:large subunit ribosomal protein L25